MWKRFLKIVFFLFVVLFLLIQSKVHFKPSTPQIGVPSPISKVNLQPHVTLSYLEDYQDRNYGWGKTFRLTNSSSDDFYYTTHYIVEYYSNDQWHSIIGAPPIEARSADPSMGRDILYGLPSEAYTDLHFNLGVFGDRFPKGRYRVVLSCYYAPDANGSYVFHSSESMISAEFIIK